jgi:hypothetical protein
MNDVSSRLTELGDALYEATRADLQRSSSPVRKRRRFLLGLGAAAVAIPATAFAASGLLSSEDVAQSLPAGTLALVGTSPTCEPVIEQVEYRCVLDRPPGPDAENSGAGDQTPAYEAFYRKGDYLIFGPDRAGEGKPIPPPEENWLGAAQPTVDATNHVNGGCRGLDAAGMTWQCYVGEAAVEEKIISRQFLGERVRGPGIG